jgi:hypothetical protein
VRYHKSHIPRNICGKYRSFAGSKPSYRRESGRFAALHSMARGEEKADAREPGRNQQ